MRDEIKFEDAENYNPVMNEKVTHKMLIMEQYRKVLAYGSKEFKKGYFARTRTPQGAVISEKWSTDEREQFSNAVEMLALALLPQFNDKMKQKYMAISEHIKSLRQTYMTNRKSDEYKSFKLEAKRELFRELCIFMKEVGIFESHSVEDNA